MNNKGQTLILFILIVPVLLLLLAFVVDTGLLLKEHTKINSTTKTILKTTFENRFDENYNEKVVSLFAKNNLPTNNIIITKEEDKVLIAIEYDKESIFGKIIGIQSYKIKSVLSGTLKEGTLQIKKE